VVIEDKSPGCTGAFNLTWIFPFLPVGEPITIPKIDNPCQREVDFYHSIYVDSLIKLFDKYKSKFGLPETEVLEVN